MFFKITALKNFPVFTEKHVCWDLFLINRSSLLEAFSQIVGLKICSNSTEIIRHGYSLVNLLHIFATLFLWENKVAEIFKSTIFYRIPPVCASVRHLLLFTNNDWQNFSNLYSDLKFEIELEIFESFFNYILTNLWRRLIDMLIETRLTFGLQSLKMKWRSLLSPVVFDYKQKFCQTSY